MLLLQANEIGDSIFILNCGPRGYHQQMMLGRLVEPGAKMDEVPPFPLPVKPSNAVSDYFATGAFFGRGALTMASPSRTKVPS